MCIRDSHYGVIYGVVDYFDPFSLVEGEVPIKEVPKGYYITQALSDRAVQEVEEYAKDDKPFFMYLAYTAPHWPLHALPEDIEKYKDTYKVGWEAIRNARYERQKMCIRDRYKDVNGDGIINGSDEVAIGATTKPNLIYGFGISAQWKGDVYKRQNILSAFLPMKKYTVGVPFRACFIILVFPIRLRPVTTIILEF